MRDETHSKKIFPAGLIAEGRDCLVVGGGRVATRKVQLLLDAGAGVTVVSPEVSEEAKALARQGKITIENRPFAPADVDGRFLVFAATDDKIVNRTVLHASQERRIICCAADGNWINSDFVTPAIFRKDELTISVSTGGRSCRRSRIIKENLARHVELVDSTDLLVMGTSHHHLNLEGREPLHLVGDKLDHAGQMISHVWGIHEFMILNTCNRIELIGVVSHSKAINSLLLRILGFDKLKAKDYYIKRGAEAFDHVSVVVSGLLSQTPGESNIVGQTKDALEHASNAGWAGGMVKEWISSALHVSKSIRHVTGPLLRRMEIDDMCIEYLRAALKKTDRARVMVVGTGAVGSGLVRGILGMNKSMECDWSFHHNKPEIPAEFKERIALCQFNDMPARFKDVDVVVCAATSQDPLLRKEHAECFDGRRKTLLIDLAMPRNVDAGLRDSKHVQLADLDDLKQWYVSEHTDMKKIMELASVTLRDHKEYYEKIISSFQSWNKGE